METQPSVRGEREWWVHTYGGTIRGTDRLVGTPDADDSRAAPQLCACCALQLVTSESEWFCGDCSAYVEDLNDEFSDEIVPLRWAAHLMADMSRTESTTTGMNTDELETLRRLHQLVDWSHATVSRNCRRFGFPTPQAVPLSEYLDRSNALGHDRSAWRIAFSSSVLSALLTNRAAVEQRAAAIERAAEQEPPCAACGRTGVGMWRDLRFTCEESDIPDEGIPQGGLRDQIDGSLPLCGSCVPACPTCNRAVPSGDAASLLEKIRDASSGGVWLAWWAGTCDDPSHQRPAIPCDAPIRIRDDTQLAPPDTSSGSSLHASAGDRHLGDLVEVAGHSQIGVIKYLVSHRLSGGIVTTIQFGDDTWIRTRLDKVRVVASLEAEVPTTAR